MWPESKRNESKRNESKRNEPKRNEPKQNEPKRNEPKRNEPGHRRIRSKQRQPVAMCFRADWAIAASTQTVD